LDGCWLGQHIPPVLGSAPKGHEMDDFDVLRRASVAKIAGGIELVLGDFAGISAARTQIIDAARERLHAADLGTGL